MISQSGFDSPAGGKKAFCCIGLMFCYVFLQINYIACIVDLRICMDANNKDCLHKIIIKGKLVEMPEHLKHKKVYLLVVALINYI
jgi:hypothetical protein